MSTVTEIREAIHQLSDQDRCLLLTQLFSTLPEPDEHDPGLLASLEQSLTNDEADRVYPLEDVRAMVSQWTTPSLSPKTQS